MLNTKLRFKIESKTVEINAFLYGESNCEE